VIISSAIGYFSLAPRVTGYDSQPLTRTSPQPLVLEVLPQCDDLVQICSASSQATWGMRI